jgi:hypothetical protein
VTRIQRRREARDQIRRAVEATPLPGHPYRDSAVFYAVLSAILLGVTYATGGGMLRAGLVAGGFFVVATAFTWLRFRTRLSERGREETK